MSDMQHVSFRRKVNFAAVSNNALKDARLSLKAKGLYALIQSYITLPNMRLTKSFLRNKCKEKEKAFDSAWKELKDCGYLKILRISSGKNDVFEYEYDLLDEANSTQPALTTLSKQREFVKSKPINPHTTHKGEDADSAEEKHDTAHIPKNGRGCQFAYPPCDVTRRAMQEVLKDEGMEGAAIWSAAIHYNTDNIHVHIEIVEPVPTRTRKEYTVIDEHGNKMKMETPFNDLLVQLTHNKAKETDKAQERDNDLER